MRMRYGMESLVLVTCNVLFVGQYQEAIEQVLHQLGKLLISEKNNVAKIKFAACICQIVQVP
jgi:hypothetical protein